MEALSSSETDLRKKKFHTFSFGWKKKKKQQQLAAGLPRSLAELDGSQPEDPDGDRLRECSGERGDQSKRVRFSPSLPLGEQLPLLTPEAQGGSELLEDPFSVVSAGSAEDGVDGTWLSEPSCARSAEGVVPRAVVPHADPSARAGMPPSSDVCPGAMFQTDVGRPVIPTPDSLFPVIAPSVSVRSEPDPNPPGSHLPLPLRDDTNSFRTGSYHPTHVEPQLVQPQMDPSASVFDTQSSICDRYAFIHRDADFTEPNADCMLTDTNKSSVHDTDPCLAKTDSSLYNEDTTSSNTDLYSDINFSLLSSPVSFFTDNSSSLSRTDLLQPSHNSVHLALDTTASFTNARYFLSNADSSLTHSDRAGRHEVVPTVDSTLNGNAGDSPDTSDIFPKTVRTESHAYACFTDPFTTSVDPTPRNACISVETHCEAPGSCPSGQSESPVDAQSPTILLPASEISDRDTLGTAAFCSPSPQPIAQSTFPITSICYYKPGHDQEMGEKGQSQGTQGKIDEAEVSMEQKDKEAWRGTEVRMEDLEPEVKMEDQGQQRNHQEMELQIGDFWADGVLGAKEVEGEIEDQEVKMENHDLGTRCQEQDAKPRIMDHGTGAKMEVLGAKIMEGEKAAEPMSPGDQEMGVIMRNEGAESGKADKQLAFQIAGQEQQLTQAGDVKEAWKPEQIQDSHGTWKVTQVAGVTAAVCSGSGELPEEDPKEEGSSTHMRDGNPVDGKEEMERGYERVEWDREKKGRELGEDEEQEGPHWGFGEAKQQRLSDISGEGLRCPPALVLQPDSPVRQVQAAEECLAATRTRGHEEKGAGPGMAASALLGREEQPEDQTEAQCRKPQSGETDSSTGAAASPARTLTVTWREASAPILRDSAAGAETASDSEAGRGAVTYDQAGRRQSGVERAVERADPEAFPSASATPRTPVGTCAECRPLSEDLRGPPSPEHSLDVVGLQSTAPLHPASGPQPLPEWDGAMNSGVGVLSTTLSVRPAPAQQAQDERKQRFHKVSLVNASERPDHSREPNGPDSLQAAPSLSSDYKETRLQVRYVEETFGSDPGVPESRISSSPFSLSRYGPAESLSPRPSQESPLSTHCGETPSFLGNSIWQREVQPDGRAWAEPAAPVGDAVREPSLNTGLGSQVRSDDDRTLLPEEDPFSGVFQAMRVELLPSPTNPTAPDLDSPNDMHALVDTLKSLDCPPRYRAPRPPPLAAFGSLPPIREDQLLPDQKSGLEMLHNSLSPPPDSGLSRTSPVEHYAPPEMMSHRPEMEMFYRSLSPPPDASLIHIHSSPVERYAPLEMMSRKSEVPPPGQRSRSLSLPFLESLQSSRQTQMNGVSMASSSRLDGSLLFSSYLANRSTENGPAPAHRSVLRTASLPECGATTGEPVTSGHLSFLMPPTNPVLVGPEYGSAMLKVGFPANSPGELSHRPSSPLDLFMRVTPPPSHLNLQRSLSSNGSILSPTEPPHRPPLSPPAEPDKNVGLKYRAFPDAYLTKEKEHGKLNPRPGKMLIYDQPGMDGNAIEVRSDIVDCTPWQLPENISIRVVRGGWVLYEKPNFMGEKIALEEGDIELTYPFGGSTEGQGNRQENGEQNSEKSRGVNGVENGEEAGHEGEEGEDGPAEKKFIIGSLRRAVRDYSVPEICLFPEENAEGKKVIFRDTSPDARIFGFPIKASSIIINAGLWLVYSKPFFMGIPRVLEVGGYPDPTAWGVKEPYVGSLHPLKIGEPRVEFPNEPKLVIYEKPYFTGKSREIYTNMRDFITRVDAKQSTFMYNAASLKVLGGCWVGYEKDGFRGHQYFLEEGEYHDWRVWGGCDAELRSVRLIRADLPEPMLELLALPEEEELAAEEEHTLEVTEAIPDVELFGFRTFTKSINVLSGAWIAYSHVDFSGHQYVLEKGFYSCCADWGSQDNRICSLQPILQVPQGKSGFKNEVMLYSEPDFQGTCRVCMQDLELLPENIKILSCRVQGGSWVFYEDHKFSGNMYVLSEGDYPNLMSMGCPSRCSLGSLKSIPMMFTVPSISFFGMESFAGREFTIEAEVVNLLAEGFNNHMLSIKVNRGCWVLCEHSNYRGRQIFLETTEISNWPKFSNLPTIGSLYPIRQKRCYFRIKNQDRGLYLSVQGKVEEMKSGRVVVTEEIEGFSDLWFYQDGMIMNKVAPSMSLQLMGNVEVGTKLMLWAMTRTPVQTWAAGMVGPISSVTFPGLVLDIKGGKTFDRDHAVVMEPSEERPSQQWELELL